jgi:MFS family permease
MITTIVNVFSTPISFYTMEKVGRRPLLLWGALGMVICQFIVAIAGTVDGNNSQTVSAQISFICIYICGSPSSFLAFTTYYEYRLIWSD